MAERLDSLRMRASVFRDLAVMLRRSKRWWLMPVVAILFLFGLALVGLQAVPYLSPFIYAVL
jgi:hypothetical protein